MYVYTFSMILELHCMKFNYICIVSNNNKKEEDVLLFIVANNVKKSLKYLFINIALDQMQNKVHPEVESTNITMVLNRHFSKTRGECT